MDSETKPLVVRNLGDILSRIGMGSYQTYTFLVLGMVFSADGGELVLVTILAVVLAEVWDLGFIMVSVLGGIIFLGMMIGTGTATLIGDDHGRMKLVRIACGILLVGAVLSVFAPEFWSFVLTRAICGVGIGMMIPILTSYTAEICPKKNRGAYMVLMGIFFPIGQIIIIGLAFWLTPGMDGGQWRILVLLAAVPVMLAFVMLFFVLQESPLQSAKLQNHELSIYSLNYIAAYNGQPLLSTQEKQIVYSVQRPTQLRGSEKLEIILNEENKKVTYRMVFLWFVAVTTFYGMLFIIPQSLGLSGAEILLVLLLVVSADIPASLINTWLVETKTTGRRKTVLVAIACGSVCLFFAGIFYSNLGVFFIFIFLAKLFMVIYFGTLFPYTSELFPTEVRSMSIGFCSVFGRLGGGITPFVMLFLYAMHPSAPYFYLSILGAAAFIVCYSLPIDTRGQELDHMDDNQNSEIGDNDSVEWGQLNIYLQAFYIKNGRVRVGGLDQNHD